jgi:hypothetical protein
MYVAAIMHTQQQSTNQYFFQSETQYSQLKFEVLEKFSQIRLLFVKLTSVFAEAMNMFHFKPFSCGDWTKMNNLVP